MHKSYILRTIEIEKENVEVAREKQIDTSSVPLEVKVT